MQWGFKVTRFYMEHLVNISLNKTRFLESLDVFKNPQERGVNNRKVRKWMDMADTCRYQDSVMVPDLLVRSSHKTRYLRLCRHYVLFADHFEACLRGKAK